MKIVFIVGSLAGGGAERVVAELSSDMVKKNHSVSVILIESMQQTYEVSPEVKIIDCSKRYSSFGFIKRVLSIRDFLKQNSPDVCVSFTTEVNIYTTLSCIGVKSRLILAERNDPRYDPKSKLFRIARRILYPLADNYVFQTEGEQEYFSKRIQDKSVVIPNPVNPNLPDRYIGERSRRFVTAVRLDLQKNLKMAIDAFFIVAQEDSEFVFDIYGQGPLRQELEQYVVNKGLQGKVRFWGNSSNLYNDILDAYGFILSSDYEGISNSMLEAMALGIPTISTDYPSGGAREVIINYYNGILVPVGDTEELAKAMLQLIKDVELEKKISNCCVDIREKFSIDKITSLWIDYFETIVLSKEMI